MTQACAGCGARIGEDICCDACWARVPTRVDGFSKPWRTALRGARRRPSSWLAAADFDDIVNAVRAWLSEHPVSPAP